MPDFKHYLHNSGLAACLLTWWDTGLARYAYSAEDCDDIRLEHHGIPLAFEEECLRC